MAAIDVWALVDHYLAPIKPYLSMDGVTEIMVNGHDDVYIEVNGDKRKVDTRWASSFELRSCIEQVANALDQKVSPEMAPKLDARLPDGARVNALLAPYAARDHCMTIRLFPKVRLTPADMLESGTFSPEMLDFFQDAVEGEKNILISGSCGAGKTTLLNVLANYIPDGERIITIEDTCELQIDKPHVVTTEAAAHAYGVNSAGTMISMADLLKNALRMNPDRIVLGEIRDAESADTFLKAINTGHSGTMTTLHANNTVDALVRLDSLATSAGQGRPFAAIQSEVRANVNVVIQVKKVRNIGRRVVEVAEIDEGRCKTFWSWDGKQHVRVSAPSTFT